MLVPNCFSPYNSHKLKDGFNSSSAEITVMYIHYYKCAAVSKWSFLEGRKEGASIQT